MAEFYESAVVIGCTIAAMVVLTLVSRPIAHGARLRLDAATRE